MKITLTVLHMGKVTIYNPATFEAAYELADSLLCDDDVTLSGWVDRSAKNSLPPPDTWRSSGSGDDIFVCVTKGSRIAFIMEIDQA